MVVPGLDPRRVAAAEAERVVRRVAELLRGGHQAPGAGEVARGRDVHAHERGLRVHQVLLDRLHDGVEALAVRSIRERGPPDVRRVDPRRVHHLPVVAAVRGLVEAVVVGVAAAPRDVRDDRHPVRAGTDLDVVGEREAVRPGRPGTQDQLPVDTERAAGAAPVHALAGGGVRRGRGRRRRASRSSARRSRGRPPSARWCRGRRTGRRPRP